MQGRVEQTEPGSFCGDAATLLAAGRAALVRGAWGDAQAAFARALHVAREPSRESAEAWAGIGLASYWRGDAGEASAAHERAFRQYRELGEAAAAGRMALWLVDEQLSFFGAQSVANGWLEHAERLLAGLAPAAEHAWLLAYRGHVALDVDGDAARALELAREGQALAGAVAAPEAALVTLALEGLALVMLGDVAAGMARLDEASAAAVSGDPGDLNAVAWACCYLIHGCESVRDFPRAAEWCQRVMAFCERWGLAPVYASCRIDYAAVLTWRGEWAAAESELELAAGAGGGRLSAALERMRLVRLAELRRLQCRLEEAEAILRGAGEHPLAIVGRACIALRRGEPIVARDLADRALRLLPQGARTARVEALLVRVRAWAVLGEPERAAADALELESTAERVGTEPLRAAAAFARGVVAGGRGDAAAAARAFEDAVVHNDRGGVPYEAAQARLELAATLARLGRHDTARREAAHARDAFRSLGAPGDVERADAVLGASSAPAGPDLPLTHRELEVLRLVAEGGSNRQIARELFISPHTVKRHLANILRKLDCPSRAAAVARVGRLGVL